MTDGNWELEVERALLKCTLEKRVAKAERSDEPPKPIFLPEKPEDNWTSKVMKLKPIYLPDKKK